MSVFFVNVGSKLAARICQKHQIPLDLSLMVNRNERYEDLKGRRNLSCNGEPAADCARFGRPVHRAFGVRYDVVVGQPGFPRPEANRAGDQA